jgi:hypothetical protein
MFGLKLKKYLSLYHKFKFKIDKPNFSLDKI